MRKIPKSDMGNEPSWKADEEYNEQSAIGQAFNWYNYSCGRKDAKEFVLDYLKFVNRDKSEILLVRSLSDSKFNLQLGWLARMFCLGFKPSQKTKEFFAERYKELIASAKKELKQDIIKEEAKQETPKVSIQDRIREKASEEMGEIDGIIDDFVTNKCKTNIDVELYIRNRNLSSVVLSRICDTYIRQAKEVEEAIAGEDEQLVEGYSNFTKPELRRFKEFLDKIVSAANKGAVANKPVRKKRKVKEKPASIVVAKMNYMKEFEELALKSVAPEKIIGALQVWTYNTKTKLLGVYNADDARGLNVKGSTLQNFNEQTSIGKRLRKPAVAIKDVLEAGKVRIKKIMPELTTKESQLTGRMNSDTIIVRVVT